MKSFLTITSLMGFFALPSSTTDVMAEDKKPEQECALSSDENLAKACSLAEKEVEARHLIAQHIRPFNSNDGVHKYFVLITRSLKLKKEDAKRIEDLIFERKLSKTFGRLFLESELGEARVTTFWLIFENILAAWQKARLSQNRKLASISIAELIADPFLLHSLMNEWNQSIDYAYRRTSKIELPTEDGEQFVIFVAVVGNINSDLRQRP